MDQAVKEMLNLGPLAGLLLALWCAWAGWTWRVIHADGAANDAAARRRGEWIAEDKFGTIYRAFLDTCLKRLENWIGDREQLIRENSGESAERGIYRLFGCNPWSWQSYDRLLLLALVYPVVSFLIGWAAGGSGQFAGVEILSEKAPVFVRFLSLLSLGGVTFCWYRALNTSGWSSLFFWLGLACVFGIVAVAGAGALAGAVVAVAVAFASAAAVAFAFAFAGAGAGAGAVAVAVAVAGAGALALDGAVAFGVAVTFGVALTFVFVFANEVLLPKLTPTVGLIFYALLTSTFLMVAYLIMRLNPESGSASALLFLTLLPLLNAPLDWLSLGITRGFLQAVRTGRHTGWRAVIWVLVDAVLAVLFLLAMAAVITLGVAFANVCARWGGGEAVFALKPFLDALRQNPLSPDHWWVWIMLGTTLLPTLVHAFLGSAAFLTWSTERFRERFKGENWLNDSDSKRDLWLYIIFTRTFAVLGPATLVWGLWALLNVHGHVLGTFLYEAMVWLAGIETVLAG